MPALRRFYVAPSSAPYNANVRHTLDMVDPTDWRLQGQEKYLKGVELRWQVYRRYPEKPDWDHDHCEFCWAKFMVEDYPDVLHEGYSTWTSTGGSARDASRISRRVSSGVSIPSLDHHNV